MAYKNEKTKCITICNYYHGYSCWLLQRKEKE